MAGSVRFVHISDKPDIYFDVLQHPLGNSSAELIRMATIELLVKHHLQLLNAS